MSVRLYLVELTAAELVAVEIAADVAHEKFVDAALETRISASTRDFYERQRACLASAIAKLTEAEPRL